MLAKHACMHMSCAYTMGLEQDWCSKQACTALALAKQHANEGRILCTHSTNQHAVIVSEPSGTMPDEGSP